MNLNKVFRKETLNMKKLRFSIIYGIALISFTTYMALSTFVISSAYKTGAGELNASLFESESVKTLDMSEEQESTEKSEEADTAHDSVKEKAFSRGKGHSKHHFTKQEEETESLAESNYEDGIIGSYESSDATIKLFKYEYEGTAVYVADVTLSSAEYIKTAFAEGTYGKNITQATSVMASDNNAILAINGDNYGSQEKGYVIRNGVVYRDEAGSSDVLCIYADGSFEMIDPSEYTADELVERGVWQAFSFGPVLVENSEVVVTEETEVGKARASNPRTAIGIIDDLHYVFVVSDGRTDESEGLSLYELATFMKNLGASSVYNLDGGGSSTMVFKGEIINNPTTTGNTFKERKVNDIVYIG